MSNNKTKSYKGYQNIRHNTTKVFTKCPRCLLEKKNPKRVKTYKNLASLDSHISTDHKDEFWTIEARILMKQFAEVIQ